MQQLPSRLQTGARVAVRGDVWSILGSEPCDAGALVALEGRGRHNRGRRATFISPFDVIEPLPERSPRWRTRRAVLRLALSAIARERPARGVWTALDGRFDVLSWQLAPVLAVLSGATRVLLADAVGLGKTLQAGLVAAELSARGLAQHTLILTPPALREAWASELGGRLGLDVAVLDPVTLDLCRHQRGAGANPWTISPVVLSSIDFVKRPEVRAAVEAVPFDLLIVDEAHHLTPGSDRAAVVSRLAGRAPWFVLASATPHGGDPAAFHALLGLGATDEPHETPMVVFRRSARDAGHAARRRSATLAVTPTAAEQALIDGLLGYARAICHGPFGTRPGVRLVAGVLARRAISSAWAAEQSLRRRLAALTGESPSMAAQTPLPWDELESADGTDEAWIGVPGLPRSGDERDWLRELIARACAARPRSSKFQRLRRLLRRTNEPAVVFTEFRDTLEACLEAIGKSWQVACVHGGLGVPERRRALADFLGGRADVLLATDVAGEGLNLQTRGRLVVTLEWPWSPQRLEQRIGRVDRIGQTRTVHAVHLTARGTVEETVVARLLARAARTHAELDRMAAPVADAAIEAAVLDGSTNALPPPAPWPPPAPPGDARLEAARILEGRRLAAMCRAPDRASPSWTMPARGVGTARAVAVVEVNAARAGRLAWSTLVPLTLDLVSAPESYREWKRVCRAIARARAVHGAAIDAARAGSGRQSMWQPALTRIGAIRRALGKGPAPLVQPSLFDRRAMRDARTRTAVLEGLDAQLARTASVLAVGDAALEIETRVVAVVPLASGGASRQGRP